MAGISEQPVQFPPPTLNTGGLSLSAITYPKSEESGISKDDGGFIHLGSDEDRELFCDPCLESGQNYLAYGYCANCTDFLCERCYGCHKTNRASRNHILLDKTTMPTAKNVPGEKVVCPVHGSVIEYYCSSCDKFGCSCLVASHPSCSVSYIPTFLAGFEMSTEYQRFEERMSKLRGKLRINSNKYHTNCAATDTSQERAKKEIQKQRKMVNKFFDKLERQMESEIDLVKEEDEEVMKEVAKQFAEIESEFQTTVSNTERKKELGQICQQFVYMKTSGEQLKQLEKKMTHLNDENRIRKYELFMSEEIRCMLVRQNKLAMLFEKYSVWKRRVIFRGTVNMKARSDEKRCNIKSMCLLNTDFLVAADLENKCVKLVNLNTNRDRIVSVLKLSSCPWDVTKVTDEQVAVTLPNEGLICFLEMRKSTHDSLIYRMINRRKVRVGHECRGIEYNRGNLIVSFTSDPAVVKILTLTGTVLNRFSTGPDGQDLFSSPRYLAIGLDENIIYVSDYQKNTVISLGRSGVVKDIYRNDLRSPAGLAVDRTDSVFVCGSRYYNVHQVYSDLSHVQLLLNHSNAEEKPQSIAYCRHTNRIFVGIEYKDCVNMFQLQ